MNYKSTIKSTILLLVGLWLLPLSLVAKESKVSRLEAFDRFTKIINTIEKYYVDKLEINFIINKSIDGLLHNLDAHSSFLDKSKFSEMQIQTKGEFGGLGITIDIQKGALTIVAPIEGTPADKAGLKAQDIILKIEDQSTLNMTIEEAVSLMRGKPKTKITLTIVRQSENKPIVVDIIRDIIKVPSVYTKLIPSEGLLYIRVVKFDKKVVSEVSKSLKNNHKKVKGVILDLRNNPGGLLDQAIGMVDLFVKKGIIVSQKGRIKSEDVSFKASSYNTYDKIPLVVLINDGSASASEIVSGALQDHKRAVLVGQKTFGKGSVQVILPVDKKEAIRLTIARYYLPNGRTIQAKGVDPDITVYPGEVPKAPEHDFKVKEADLKKHLESELEKIDGKKEKTF